MITLISLLLSLALVSRGNADQGKVQAVPYRSVCDSDTEWNRKSVGAEIKRWIGSIRVDDSNLTPKDKAVSFYDDPNGTLLRFAGNVDENGYAMGPFWVSGGWGGTGSAFNNGFYYSHLDLNGMISNRFATFLFPDMETALHGLFINDTMISGRQVRVTAERCRKGIKEILVSRPEEDAFEFRFERPTRIRTGHGPTVADPYERKTVYVRWSAHMGDSLFAKRDIAKGEQIAYYSGIIYNETEFPTYLDNMTDEDRLAAHKMLIVLHNDIRLNLPSEFWSLAKYRATLGHKVNHSFNNTNCIFNSVHHPRFGIINGIEASKDIPRGSELFADYDYSLQNSPSWYLELYREEVGDIPEGIVNEQDTSEDLITEYMSDYYQ